MKFLCIKITKHAQDLYAENYERAIEEIKEDIKDIVFIDWKIQPRKDVNTPQSDLQI